MSCKHAFGPQFAKQMEQSNNLQQDMSICHNSMVQIFNRIFPNHQPIYVVTTFDDRHRWIVARSAGKNEIDSEGRLPHNEGHAPPMNQPVTVNLTARPSTSAKSRESSMQRCMTKEETVTFEGLKKP